jgi:hypothetical protein
LGGEGAGGFDGAGVFVAQGKEAGGRLVSIVRTDTCMAGGDFIQEQNQMDRRFFTSGRANLWSDAV